MEGLSVSSSVHDMVVRVDGVWPNSWIERDSSLLSCSVPVLQEDVMDTVCWVGKDNALIPFSVKEV